MTHGWILDVLKDLRCFAGRNGLPVLAEHLDDTCLIAESELAKLRGSVRSQSFTGIGAKAGPIAGAPRATTAPPPAEPGFPPGRQRPDAGPATDAEIERPARDAREPGRRD